MTVNQAKHAIIIGGSIAGLLAAKVLTKHFERVTIVEQDKFPDQPEHRQSIPQSPHAHILLKRGQEILEQLFPGIEADLISAGALTLDWGTDFPWLGFNGWAPRFSSGVVSYACSRNVLEWTIRRRLSIEEHIIFVQSGQVISLLSNPNGTSVTGVRLQLGKEPETDLTADLVVDASGRNSHSPQWLEAMGYTPPQETVIKSFLGYASRWYQRPNNLQSDWQCLYVTVQPPNNTRGGFIYQVEGDRWVLTLIGTSRDYPPTNEAAFLNFARSLRSPAIYEAIKDAEPISPIYGYRRTENCLRHYEKLSKFPESFVVMGDAVCAFNPVYGQGMTTAALAALTLDQCLTKQLTSPDSNLIGLSRRFQKQLSKVIAVPWLMTTGEDFRWSATEGGQPDLMTRIMQRYLEKVLVLQTESAYVHKVFLEVIHMLKPPSAFFQPRISMQVLKLLMNLQRKDEQLINELSLPKPL